MIIKLVVDAEQLAKLHVALADEGNFFEKNVGGQEHPNLHRTAYVFIKSCKGEARERQPVPRYEVVLEVCEWYEVDVSHPLGSKKYAPTLVPMSKLRVIFEAIGLYPEQE